MDYVTVQVCMKGRESARNRQVTIGKKLLTSQSKKNEDLAVEVTTLLAVAYVKNGEVFLENDYAREKAPVTAISINWNSPLGAL